MKAALKILVLASILLAHVVVRGEQVKVDQMAQLLDTSQNETTRMHSLEVLRKLPAAEIEVPYRNIYAGQVQSEEPILIGEPAKKNERSFENLSASHWMQFQPDGDFMTAELHLFHASWPHTRWMIEMQLLDADGEVISSDLQFFENSGIVERVAEVGREKILLHFQKSTDVEVAKYRLAINTIWTSKSNPMQVDKEIPLELTLDAPRVSASRFTIDRRMFRETIATAHVSYENWPATTCTLTLNLLDDQGNSIADTKETFANGGFIRTAQSLSWKDLVMHFNTPPDLSKASRCEMTLERLAPKRYLDGSEQATGEVK